MYTVGQVKCRVCNHEWTAVQADGDLTDLECPNCGSLSGDVIECDEENDNKGE